MPYWIYGKDKTGEAVVRFFDEANSEEDAQKHAEAAGITLTQLVPAPERRHRTWIKYGAIVAIACYVLLYLLGSYISDGSIGRSLRRAQELQIWLWILTLGMRAALVSIAAGAIMWIVDTRPPAFVIEVPTTN